MENKVAFFTEGPWTGYISKSSLGRTDMNWLFVQNAYHISISDVKRNKYLYKKQFDIGIYIIPKNNPDLSLDTLNDLKSMCSKIGIMQESDQIAWQRYSVDNQINYLHFVSECDFILCHNEIDLKYFSGLFNHDRVFIMPTLMLTDNLPKLDLTNKSGVMVGGTWSDWYSGGDSYMIAQMFDEPIFAPSMGRKRPDEDLIDGLTYLPYTDWNAWMSNLSKCKYAVHLMRTYAAGSFPLNCAFVNVPCIGWKGCDTQQTLFPSLTFDEGDMVSVRKMVKHLKTTPEFYNHVIAFANKQLKHIYSKEKFQKKMKETYEKIMDIETNRHDVCAAI